MSGAAFNRGESKQDYETPADFIHAVVKRWGPINFDLAANTANAKASSFYTEEQNSLVQDWTLLQARYPHLWLNPPYGRIAPWAMKCADTHRRLGTIHTRICLLVPAAVGSNWFRDHVFGVAGVYLLNGRIQFVGAKDPYPKDLMLCRFGEPSSIQIWSWKENTTWSLP